MSDVQALRFLAQQKEAAQMLKTVYPSHKILWHFFDDRNNLLVECFEFVSKWNKTPRQLIIVYYDNGDYFRMFHDITSESGGEDE